MKEIGYSRKHQQSANSRPDNTNACASCGTTDNLVEDDGNETVFCDACAAPLAELAFREYYCDLGGEA